MYLELFLGDRIYSLMILKKNKYTIFLKKTLKIYSYTTFHISSVKNEFINSVHIVTYILLFNKIIYDKCKYLKCNSIYSWLS